MLNDAVRGGGLALLSSTGHLGRARSTDCYLGNNTASGQGGGIYATGSVLLAKGLSLWGNAAVQQRGGMWLHSCSVESDTNGIAITQSSAEGHGGGWFIDNSAVRVSRLIVGDDPAPFGNQCGGHGGGLYATNSSIVMAGGLFQNNTAMQPAGPPAGGHGGGVALFNTVMIITNSTEYADGYERPRFLQNRASTNNGMGGAIHVGPNSLLQVYETEFFENAAHAGGAIQAENAGSLFEHTAFTFNEAEHSGGGLGVTDSVLMLYACRLEQNRAINGNGGGVWAAITSTLQITTSRLVGNVASNRGGGIYANDSFVFCHVQEPPYYTGADGWPLLLEGNVAREGGAMMLHRCQSTVSHAALIANSAPAYASGISVVDGQILVAQSLIKEGTQSGGVSGLPGAAICFTASPTGTVLFCTLADNQGDGLRIYGNPHITVTNSILWDNAIWNINTNGTTGGSLTVAYSDIRGGWPGIGNIDADPEFHPNHHLRPGSPCINAAGALPTSTWPYSPDIDGDSRVAGIPDMGFDEFVSSPTPTPTPTPTPGPTPTPTPPPGPTPTPEPSRPFSLGWFLLLE